MRFFLIIVIVLGIFFRFTDLDHKVYWYDEAITSLRASGYTEKEVVQDFSEKSVVSVSELQRYQQPDGTRSIIDTAKSLVQEDPQHPPLYYSFANFWFRTIGTSPAIARLLPALLSLLAFPSAYWLCKEIFVETGVFSTNLPGYFMIGLIAVSPFHLLYAQESRQYELWVVTTLLCTTALLQAIRLNTRISWGIYTFTMVINLYTFLLAGLTLIAHGIYVILIYGFRNYKIIKNYFIASVLGVIFFLPYVRIFMINYAQANKGLEWTFLYSLEKSELKNIWIQHIGRIFFDVNQDLWDFYLHRVLLVLVIYAFYCLCRQTPISVWLLIILITTVNTLPLMIPDWISGGMRSQWERYMIPGVLGVQLTISYLSRFWYQKFWRLTLIILILGSILSCTVSSQAIVWYNKGHNGENMAVGKIVNQTTHPLLISDSSVGHLLSLSYSLKPHVQVLLKPHCATCSIQSSSIFGVQLPSIENFHRFSAVFLYKYSPSQKFIEELAKQKNYKFKPVVFGFAEWSKERPVLWKLIPMELETRR